LPTGAGWCELKTAGTSAASATRRPTFYTTDAVFDTSPAAGAVVLRAPAYQPLCQRMSAATCVRSDGAKQIEPRGSSLVAMSGRTAAELLGRTDIRERPPETVNAMRRPGQSNALSH
jgi:hypothetical protein